MKNENIQKLTNLITKKIGFTISNKETAIEILNNYQLESETKTLKTFYVNNGLLNSTLVFY